MSEDAPDYERLDTAALFTPVPNGKVLAALCALNGAKGQVLENSAGTLAVLDDPSEEALDKAASAISSFAKERPLMALERRGGQITAYAYQAGVRGAKQPPGLLLNEAPGVVSTIMSGAQTIDEVAATHPDKVFSARMGRFKAFRQLRAAAKEAKRRLRAEGQ